MKKSLLLILLFFYCFCVNAQNAPQVYCDLEVPLSVCNPGESTTLIANYLQTYSTNSNNYTVTSIPFSPTSAVTGGQTLDITVDDIWSPIFTLPFPFCFYGQNYTKLLVGANGVLSFNILGVVPGGTEQPMVPGDCNWSFSGPIPNTSFPIKNAIYGVYQDIHPGTITNPAIQNINYYVSGVAPNRVFVLTTNEMPQFGCGTSVGLQTYQIKLYETTNAIDVLVFKRTACTSWQGGVGVIGVQNQAGTLAASPPGRNTGTWSATNEAWRFTPSSAGPSNVNLTWLENGNPMPASTVNVNPLVVTPPGPTTVYTAIATYTSCDGSLTAVQDSQTVKIGSLPILDPKPLTVCVTGPGPYTFNLDDQTTYMIDAPNNNAADYEIHYYVDNAGSPGAEIPAGSLATYVSAGAGELIWVLRQQLISPGCDNIQSFPLNAVILDPSGSFSYTPSSVCSDIAVEQLPSPNTLTPGGTYSLLPTSPTGLTLNPATGGITPSTSTPNQTYTVVYEIVTPSCPLYHKETTVTIAPCCNVTAANSGPICSGSTFDLTATTTSTATLTYHWDGPDGYSSNVQNPTGVPVPTIAAPPYVYTVTASLAGVACSTSTTTVTVNLTPAAPVVTTPVDYCQNIATVPTLSATGTNLLWYTGPIGGLGSPITPTLGTTVGSTTYYVSQSASGCEGPRAAIVVNVHATPATPTFTLVQPNCTVSTGAITVTSPLGASFDYSIDNGVTYQASPLFTLVAPGNYNIVVRDITTISQCTSSAAPATINAPLGIPATPVASVTQQPTCTTPTGTITITAPTGNYQYSIDGGTIYQPGLVFSNLTPNTSYTITVRDMTTTCVASGSPILVNPIPNNPTAPVASVTQQPTCTTPTGTITLTVPTGANFEYSINGGTTYQAGVIFAGLTPNTSYSITVRDIPTGCITTGTPILVNPIPNNPTAPTVSVSQQPTCAVITGQVTVSAPTGATYEYSINGGTSYQTGLTFAGLTAGATYNVTTRDTATGCVSSATPVTIGPLLNVPTAPVASVTQQPTCTTPTGTITVTGPLSANYAYSINGGTTYQAGLVFAGLAPNTSYTITVRDTGSGCTTIGTPILVNPIPNNPTVPVASVTHQPTCSIPTGSITVTAPIGANFQYSINGGTTYQSTVAFNNLTPNTSYSITVRDIPTGCITTGTPILVSPITPNPLAATTTVTQPTCTVFTGTIKVTAPIGTGFEYSINGGTTYQSSVTFANLAPNTSYVITVREIATGCTSNSAPIAINPIPPIPATPTAAGANVCLGDAISLTATSTVTGANYSWTGPNGFTSNVQNPTIPSSTAAMAGTYTVIVYQTPDCPSLSNSVFIAVNPKPKPTLTPGYVCVDGQTGAVLSTYTLATGMSDATYDFQWYNTTTGTPVLIAGETQSSYVVNTPGSYGVVATDVSVTPSCPSTMVVTTVGTSSAPKEIQIIASNYFAEVQTITINATPAGNYEYSLDNGVFQSSNVFTNVGAGDHEITVRDIHQCGELPGSTYIVDFPRFFTPNGDGYHDEWNISALSAQINAKIHIFDRFGKLLKEIRPSSNGWNGTFNQQFLPSTDYWFVVYYDEQGVAKEFRSHFAMKR